ncbi:hypothetical protein [Parabacteroides chinchillae]|uniref:Uncharacterized protein n=1 Tax=Parabacteroides chinchillae TaxID=871327 RepID=A0A8G2F4R7_9BACT|nr:hypothetical protein [Parabacteroides chinchillae]SEG01825.1 hypothetical protein SAMN05444001_11256 [Parabacteroides chinchillae]
MDTENKHKASNIEALTFLLPRLGAASHIYTGKAAGLGVTKENVMALVTLRDDFPDLADIENGLLHLIFNEPKEKSDMIMESLSKALQTVVNVYEHSSIALCGSTLSSLWNTDIAIVEKQIEQQQCKLRDINDELREASNSYEMTPFNGASPEYVALLERKLERYKADYDKERHILDGLYSQKRKLSEQLSHIGNDLFGDIYSQCSALLSSVRRYFDTTVSDDHDNENVEMVSVLTYFPMHLVSKIYELCNGSQFKEMDEVDFFHAINLHPDSHLLQINPGEKVRVCYLISRLGTTLGTPSKEEWTNAILSRLDIKSQFYRSKYRQPVSDMPSEANAEFAAAIKEIFDK